MRTRIEHGTLICHRGGRVDVLEDHTIEIAGGTIAGVYPGDTSKRQNADTPESRQYDTNTTQKDGESGDVRVIEASRHIILPGLVNTHHHLYQSLTRGLKSVQDAPLFDWLTALYARWRHLDFTSVRAAAQISIAELQLSGCTTTSDHFYVFPRGSDVRIEAVLEAAESMGMRIHACRGSMSVGVSAGGLPPDDCTQSEDAILVDCTRVLDRFHDPAPLAMRRIDLAPCSPFSVSPELLRETAALARERGALLHTHAAETLDEQRYCIERFGVRPIELLDRAGWLGTDVYLAHCVHLDASDIRRLAETRTGVAHCPCSNMRLGSGIPPVRALLDAGARVGLGVDGSSSNDGGHLLAEARQALLLQRVTGGAGALSVAEAFTLATLGGAAVLNRPLLGNIERGCAADLAMYRRDDIALAGAVEQDPLGAMTLCHVHRADRVIINGKTVVEDGRITTIDLPELIVRFNRLVGNEFRE